MATLTIDINETPDALRRVAHFLQVCADMNDRGALLEDEQVEQSEETPKQEAASTATTPGTTAADTTENTADAHASGGTATQVDLNGVEFDVAFCGNAAEPFYATGKRKGQWKKRKGVDDAAYDAWYIEQLGGTAPAVTEAAEADVAQAFSTSAAPSEEPAPADVGALMGWVAEHQAAQRLAQADIDSVYQQLGLVVTDLFPPNAPEVVNGHISNIHTAFKALLASRGHG